MRHLVLVALLLTACNRGASKPELWVYTSLYKDTIADLQPRLAAQFPDFQVNFFQAGSEEVAAKVNAEELAGGTKADLLIFSDRFWFEEMAQKGRLHKHVPEGARKVPETLRSAGGFYSAVSLPVMVMVYNGEAIPESQAPRSFKEMADPKWKGKFCTGSPLSSGTNFTTVAFLQKAYGWDYFRALRKNDTIAEGGNSAVIRRVETRERPVGWVLLENALRLKADTRVKVIYPTDGPILQSNVLAITQKKEPRAHAEKLADWFFGAEGQEAMTRSFMYPAVPGIADPKGAAPLSQVLATAPKWSPELLQDFMKSREAIKEEFSRIMLQ
jgi:iron(III) transport system substrate-binding protein